MKLYLGFIMVMFCTVAAFADQPQRNAHKKQDAIAERLKVKGQLKPIKIPSISYLPKPVEIPSAALLLPPLITPTFADPLQDIRISTALNAADMGRDDAGQQITSLLKELYPGNIATSRILLFTLASWHEAKAEYLDAAHAMEQLLSLPLPVADHANATLAAARFYWKAGMHSHAKVLYDRVPSYGYGWATGMALYDEATIAMEANNPQDAEQLLRNALRRKTVIGLYTKQIQTTLYTTLAFAQYRQGKLKQARRSANKSQKLYKELKFVLPNEGIEGQYNLAGEMKQWIARWKKSPFFVEKAKVTVPVPKSTFDHNDGKGVVYFSVYVHSQNEMPLDIKTSHQNVVQSILQPKTVKGTFGVIHEIALQSTLSENDLPLHTSVTISSPQARGKTAKIEVELVPEPLVLTQ